MATETPDAVLIAQYVNERSGAPFTVLVERYLGVVYRAAVRHTRGDVHAAADVTQGVFVVLARKAATLRQHDCLVGWLHSTTRYVARDLLRATARRRHYEQEAAAMNEPHEPSAEWEKLRPIIDEVLEELGDRDREAVLLRYFADLPFGEIGRRLGLAENSARMRVERALDKLEARLHARGIASTSAALSLLLANEAVAESIPASLAGSVVATAFGTASAPIGVVSGFMSVTKASIGVTAALLVVALGTATYSHHQKRAAEEALAAARADERLQAREAAGAQATARELAETLARAQAKPERPAARGDGDTSPGSAANSRALDPRQLGKKLMANHPELKRAFAAWAEARTRARFGPLWRELNLTPEQIQRFIEIEITSPARLVIQMGYGPSGTPVILALGDDDPSTEFQRLSDLLGPAHMRQWARYSNDDVARDTAARLVRDLTFSEAPLTPEQASTLTSILASSQRAPAGKRSSRREIDWDAALAQAQLLLRPEQSAALAAIRDEILATQAASVATPPSSPATKS